MEYLETACWCQANVRFLREKVMVDSNQTVISLWSNSGLYTYTLDFRKKTPFCSSLMPKPKQIQTPFSPHEPRSRLR